MSRRRPDLESSTRKMTRAYAQAGKYINLGLQFAITTLICLFLGLWLDERLGTSPGLLLVGTFFGAGAGFYSMYRTLMAIQKKERQEEHD